METVKVVIRCTDLRTGRKDVIIKTGSFQNTPDSLASAFTEGVYDKYALVSKSSTYTIPKSTWGAPNKYTSYGFIEKLSPQGAIIKRVIFSARLSVVQ